MTGPIQSIEYVDIYPKRFGDIDGIQFLVSSASKLVTLIRAYSRSYVYIFSSVFDTNYNEIYHAISIAAEASSGAVTNPAVLMLNGKYLYFWYHNDSFTKVRSIQSMLVEDNAWTFAHSDTAYGRTRGAHPLFINQINDHYVTSLSHDNSSFVIAAANPDGNILIKNFDSSFNLLSSIETHIPFINNQQKIISINGGYILFYNDPESGIHKVTYDQNLSQIGNGEIVIDANIGEIVNFNAIKSDSAILLICNNEGVIEAVALDLNGVVMGDITVINNPAQRYSLISSSEVKVGPVEGGSLNIIQGPDGNKYGLFLDSRAKQWGDKFEMDNDVRGMVSYPDGRHLIFRADPLTNLDRVDAQIIRINYDLVPSFTPSPSPSPSQYLESDSTTPLISPSAEISDSTTPSISPSAEISDSTTPSISPSVMLSYFLTFSASITPTSRPQITATSSPDSNADGFNNALLTMVAIFTVAAITIMVMASSYYCLRRRRASEGGDIEMTDLDSLDQSIKDFLIRKQEEIIDRAVSKDESKKYILLKKLLALAVKYKERNKLEGGKSVRYDFGKDDKIFVQIDLAYSAKDSIVLEFGLKNQDESLLSVEVSLVKIGDNEFIVYKSDNQEMFNRQFKDYFANKKLLMNNLVDLLIRVNMQMIDYSPNPDKQAESLLSSIGFVKKNRANRQELDKQISEPPSRVPRIKEAKQMLSKKCLIM